jgi:hypothetical protein
MEREVIRLPALARGWRVVFLLVTASLFLAGTAVGTDNWWPVGPWRMYATSTPPSGSVYSLAIQVREGKDPTWQNANLTPTSIGLTRAEVEGRVPQMTADPDILGTLARSHSRLRPHEPPWVAVRVVRNEALLSGGAPTGQVLTTTVVSWTRS